MTESAINNPSSALLHEDHPEGPIDLSEVYPQEMRHRVILDQYDNDIRDGDSNAILSYQYGDAQGEIFHVSDGDMVYEVYPHGPEDKPLLFRQVDASLTEEDFVRDAVLKTMEMTKGTN